MPQKLKIILTVAVALALIAAIPAGAARLITGKQIKNSTLTGTDVKNSTLTGADIKNRSLTPADIRGLTSTTGPTGPTGPAGPKGDTGTQGPAGPFPDGTIPTGKTLRGNYALAAEGPAGNNGALAMTGISFGYQFPTVPTTHIIQQGDPTPAGCTGNATTPGANSGHLCVFEQQQSNRGAGYPAILTVNRQGAAVYLFAGAAAAFAYSAGTWAATS